MKAGIAEIEAQDGKMVVEGNGKAESLELGVLLACIGLSF